MALDYLDLLRRLAAKQQETLRTALNDSELTATPYPYKPDVVPVVTNRLSNGSLDEQYSQDIQVINRQIEAYFYASRPDEGTDDEKYELVYTAVQALYNAFAWGNPLTSTAYPTAPSYIDNSSVVLISDTGLSQFDTGYIGTRLIFEAELFNI